MKTSRFLFALVLVGGLGIGATAQEVVVSPPQVVPPAPTPAPVVMTEEVTYAVEEVPEADTRQQDVWWGNRSISYGNYLKFDRITVAALGPAGPSGPVVMDTLHFERDKAVLNPAAHAIVDDAIRILRANPSMTAHVEVQAGVQPMTGRRLTLSQQRTDSVRRYLTENGIAAERITVTTGAGSRGGSSAVVIPISGN
jgi:outer membrane protein OmpA-like peptidoglycan-associated protein